MSKDELPDPEAALARFIEGEPRAEDVEALAAAMADDPAFAPGVIRMLKVDHLLRRGAQRGGSGFVESLEMRLKDRQDDRKSRRSFGLFSGLDKVRIGPRFRTLATAAVVACLTLAVLVAGRRSAVDQVAKAPASPASKLAERSVAVLARVVDAHWDSGDVSIDEGTALAPRRLRLTKGLAQIEFVSGAVVILESPCDFELLSPVRAVCHRGKVRAHVPAAASGFAIAAAGINAVDLGSEFALKVDEQGQGQVHVLDGAVELHGDGEHPPIRGVRMLKAGEGVDFAPGGGLRDLVADPTVFVDRSRLLQLENEHHRQRYRDWLAHSLAMRKDPDLLLYYTFEDPRTWERTVRNVAGAQPHGPRDGAVVGCLWCAGRWPEKAALEFKRPSDRVRINVPGEFDTLSLAAWVRIEGLNNWLSGLMLTDGWDIGEPHWQITADGEMLFGVSQPDSGSGAQDRHQSPPVLGPEYLGRWVHLATVYDKQTSLVVHYLDGRRVSQGTVRVSTPMRIGQAELGNWSPYPLVPKKIGLTRSLNGRIDEFAILRRALSDDEVRRMYELGKPSS